uniref:CRC domain-containing protein n=1 Tax=Globisporangium ultimum (strain ATCC 200006 / CBS 805.95 / DAOM BR144) TaxID=431595 RepID=K3X538_GLOUD
MVAGMDRAHDALASPTTRTAHSMGAPDEQENRAPDDATSVALGAKFSATDLVKSGTTLELYDGDAIEKQGRSAVTPRKVSKSPMVKKQRQQSTPRCALRVLDANRMTPGTSAVAPALLQKPPTPSRIGGIVPLNGQKRKHRSVESPRTFQKHVPTVGAAFDHDYESENLAWLDMLVALLERKYGRHSIPVSIQALEDARMFEPRQKKQQLDNAAGGGQETDASQNSSNSTSHSSRLPGKDPAVTEARSSRNELDQLEKEKEVRRERILRRHAQQIQDASVSSSTCCGCKTGCLKMYCVCFSTRGFCHSSCACEDCKNSRQNKEQRIEAIQNYLANDPRAFSYASLQRNAVTSGFMQLLPQKSSSVVLRGCRCKKSKCLKKYCECYQNGIACTAHCRCVDCSNDPNSEHHLHKASHAAAKPKPFHEIHITVTKKPKRNYVQKTMRLAL